MVSRYSREADYQIISTVGDLIAHLLRFDADVKIMFTAECQPSETIRVDNNVSGDGFLWMGEL